MKKIVLSIAVLATAVLFSACSKSSSPSNNASVMFVNGSAGTANVSVTANSAAISGAQNLAFLSGSGYQNVGGGSSVNIGFTLTASGLSLTSGTTSLTANNNYSVFLGGSVTNPQVLVEQDILTTPASGDAEIRLVNLSPDTLSLTGIAAATSGSITFGAAQSSISASAFTPVAAGTYKLEVQDATKPLSLEEISSQTLVAGKIYTLIYTGTGTGTGTSVYTLTLLNNN